MSTSTSIRKPAADLSVRFATPADAEILAELIAAFAAYERLPNHSTPASLAAELSASDRVMSAVLAFKGGRAVGFAVFFQTYATFAARRGIYLEDVFVRDDCRNQGVATVLLRFIARHAVASHVGRVEFTVLLWNTVAIEFFETLGATPNSAWTTYRLSGEWLARLAAET